MSYKEKPQLHLYEYKNNSFSQIAIIDDFQEVSFEHNLYQAGQFTITINYNIPNALLFERGMFIQFGSDPYDFGEILSIRDVIGQDGKGSQIRTITGYDARYIFKRRIIKNLNANGMWKMTAKGEVCIRELIKSECGLLAEEKRQLPVKNIPSYLNKFESEPLPVNECYWGGCYSKEKHLFILTGEKGTILRSRDAFNWEVALNLGGGWFERCFYSDHYHAFFTVGNSAHGSETQVSYIYKSTDGITWTKVYQSESFIYLTDVCENDNGVLVAVGRECVVISPNGTSWALRNSNYRFQGVYFAKGVFIGLLTDGIATSRTGGVSWQKVNNIQNGFFYACYSPKLNKIVAVGRYIYESFDGENFILAKTPEQYPLRFISWNDKEEMFYACGFEGYAIRSSDGYEWEEIDLPIEKTDSTYLTGIFFSEESRTFVFGGYFTPRSTIYLAQKIDAVGKEYSVSEAYTNLYEVCKTIATQSEIGWRVKFDDGSLTLECYEGTDRSDTVQFSTDFDSLRDGEFLDSSESYSNAIYIGGKGQNDERDIYEGEDGTPNGLDRFESWDDQSQMTTTDEYTAEALSMLSQYGQTVNVSGNGLAKCPYVYKEQYDVGDIITIAFSGKTAKVQILSVTERWAWNQYDINFSFGKPHNNLAEQLQLMLRKIQGASNKEKATESVKWYTIPAVTSMPADDVTFNTIGFTGTMTANKTFTLYRDSEGTGAKSYNVYCKNLSGNYNLILTTGVSGATNFTIKGGQNIVARILVDENGNIVSQSMTATNTIESGNNQPVESGAVADEISNLTEIASSLPTDAVLHYSFDEVPDYPDGTKNNIDNYLWNDYNTTKTDNPDGTRTYQANDTSLSSFYFGFHSDTSIEGKIFLLKFKIISGTFNTINRFYCNSTTGIFTLDFEIKDKIVTIRGIIPSGAANGIRFASIQLADVVIQVLDIYIGDGSYSTPIIDNANGEWNSVSQSGVAVSGVSGKGLKCFQNNRVNFGDYFLQDSFTVSIWVNPENNTAGLQAECVYRYGQFVLRNGWTNSNKLVLFLYAPNGVTLINEGEITDLLSPNIWTHIVITKNNLTVCAYINGAKVKTFTVASSQLRRDSSISSFNVNGTINTRPQSYDDLLIFDRALSETEVKALYQNKANTPKYYSWADWKLSQV